MKRVPYTEPPSPAFYLSGAEKKSIADSMDAAREKMLGKVVHYVKDGKKTLGRVDAHTPPPQEWWRAPRGVGNREKGRP